MRNKFPRRPERSRSLQAALALGVALLALLATLPYAAALPGDQRTPGITIDDGVAPDGSPYRWILSERLFVGRGTTPDGRTLRFRFRLPCLDLTFPGLPGRGAAGGCGLPPRGARALPIQGIDARFLQARSEAVEQPDVVVAGTTAARVARVRVVYTDAAGERHDLPVDFARREAALGSRGVRSFGVFTAFVRGDWAARDRLADRERELRPGDPSLPPSGAFDLSDLARGAIGCDGDGPTGPFTVIGFDRDGRRLKVPDFRRA
jgi:hypothetical protein